MDTEDLKLEFAQWLIKYSPDSYKRNYLGYTEESILEKLTEIDSFFSDIDLFEVAEDNIYQKIATIKDKINRKGRDKNPEFEKYDSGKGNGVPKAIIGKKNYFVFLKENFESINYWLFQGNPKIFDFESALSEGSLNDFTVTSYKDKIQVGDKVIIWLTGDKKGCYALAEVTSTPAIQENSSDDKHWKIENKNDLKAGVKITHNLSHQPILWSDIKDKEEFKDLNVGNQGTNFSATQNEYKRFLSMAENNTYTWVKTHKEIVEYLRDKKNSQKELIQLLESLGIDHMNDVNEEKEQIKLEEIDPFTFFSYIYKYGSVRRLKLLKAIANKINIHHPYDANGIPSANAQGVWFFPKKFERNNQEVSKLWDLFFNALDNSITNELFSEVLSIKNVAKSKITEGMFYVKPEHYLPINGPVKPFLKDKFGIDPEFETFKEYQNILEELKKKTQIPFYELSHKATLWNPKKIENNFETVVKSFSKEDVSTFFDLIDEIVDYLDLSKEDQRVVYSCGKNYLNINIGQRFVWRLKPRKGKKFWIMTKENFGSNYYSFEGKPKHYYHLFNDKSEIVKSKKSFFEAIKIELQRSKQSGYLQHNDEDFEKAVFDKSYRSKFLNPKEMNNSSENLNQILFGPPGTGKTYNTISEAVKIVDKDFYDQNINNRDALVNRYRELLITNWDNTEGQIAFSTFHQSFTYEDFIEGIKPKTTAKKDVYYDIEPGIFKRICELANSSKSTSKVKTESKIDWSAEEFRNAFFYKISLGEANNPDDKEIYEFCKDNGYVSIGFGGAIDYSGKSETEIKDLCEENDSNNSAGSQLSAFIHGLSVGDYVMVSKGNRYVRAIGKVTGEYEYHEDFPIEYNHFRKVEWIIKDEIIPVKELYYKKFSQRTIYRLNHDQVKEEFFTKEQASLMNQNRIDVMDENVKPYVLIIDEINRGNVSSIFGELISLIEPDKRSGREEELNIILPYSKEEFSVPDNVYIIGTMNTADRSIEALDSALRRRFSFSEINSEPSRIDKILEKDATWNSISLSEVLDKINKRITVLIDKDHQIGHSYFLKLKDATNSNYVAILKNIFSNNIIPLLQEYFFNDYTKIGMVLGSGFIKVNNYEDKLFAEIENSLEDEYSDIKEYHFTNLYDLDDYEFKNLLLTLLNK